MGNTEEDYIDSDGVEWTYNNGWILKSGITGHLDIHLKALEEYDKKEVEMEEKQSMPSVNFRYFLCDKNGDRCEFFVLESDRDKRANKILTEIVDPENECLEDLDGLFCGYVTHVGNSNNQELEKL
jgi:hypothetical protein